MYFFKEEIGVFALISKCEIWTVYTYFMQASIKEKMFEKNNFMLQVNLINVQRFACERGKMKDYWVLGWE